MQTPLCKHSPLAHFIICCGVGILFTSCVAPRSDSLVIWGDKAEYVAYVDYYNNTNSQNKAVFYYKEAIFPDQIERNNAPDIIIAQNITYQSAKRAMRAIPNGILNRGDTASTFYDDVLAVGTMRRAQKLIPLSFNIPVIIFARGESALDLEDLSSLTLTQLQRNAEQLNRYSDGVLSQVGFSPQWDTRFLYLGTEIYGANYHEDRQGNIQWDGGEIFETLRYFRGWNSEIERDDLRRFVARYVHRPFDTLLIDKRIGFFFDDLIGYSKRDVSQIDFLPIASATGVFVNADMVFIGIHRYGRHTTQAHDFIRWILTEETQRALIEHTHRQNIELFGFANGLSTLQDISMRIIPRYYPWLIGHVPQVLGASIPNQTPKHWNDIRVEVIQPWLQNFLDGIDQESIENEIIKWRKREGRQ